MSWSWYKCLGHIIATEAGPHSSLDVNYCVVKTLSKAYLRPVYCYVALLHMVFAIVSFCCVILLLFSALVSRCIELSVCSYE